MRKGSPRTNASHARSGTASPPPDPRDQEIERLRTMVAELTRRNEVLQEALRHLQGARRS